MRKEDIEKFNRVYDAAFPILIRISFHMTGDFDVAEEICQEAFIRYLERVEKFPDDKQSTYWLIRVVKNLTLNFEKRKLREQRAYKEYLMEPEKASETGESAYLRDETKKIVQKILDKLPEKLKTALVLREYGDLSYKEIGKILHISEANVKVRVYRAREAISSMIEKGEVYVP
jgi:RNA polymerase sigma factor (sigma-70 family)